MKTGNRIKLLRTSLGLTQEHIAEYLGVSRELISMIESNEREIGLNNLEKLADLFGVELIDLVNEDEENVTVTASLSFRAGEIQVADLEQVSKFRCIVKNYLKMQKIYNETIDVQ